MLNKAQQSCCLPQDVTTNSVGQVRTVLPVRDPTALSSKEYITNAGQGEGTIEKVWFYFSQETVGYSEDSSPVPKLYRAM